MKRALVCLACLISLCGSVALSQENANPVYKDPKASIPDRVRDLVGRMTVEEKVAQLESNWTLPAFPGFKMPSPFEGDHLNEAITCRDGSYHVINLKDIGSRHSVCVDGGE